MAKVLNQTDNTTVTTQSALDGQSVVREDITNTATPTTTEVATYLIGARGPEYRRPDATTSGGGTGGTTSTTTTRWYAYDGLGSVLGEIDGDAGSSTQGDLTKSRVYDAYGSVRAEDANYSKSGHRFVGGLGHPSEGETGLIYMRARYMDPAVGRFVSEDPSANGSNWFVYCDNDPVNHFDLNGKNETSVLQWTMRLVMAAMAALGYIDPDVHFTRSQIHAMAAMSALNELPGVMALMDSGAVACFGRCGASCAIGDWAGAALYYMSGVGLSLAMPGVAAAIVGIAWYQTCLMVACIVYGDENDPSAAVGS